MSDLATPLRENASALPDDSQTILVAKAIPPPADPAIILAQQTAANGKPARNQTLWWVLGGLAAAQLAFPYEIKPTVLAGNAASGFYRQIMNASVDSGVERVRCEHHAQTLADLEARRAEALGQCMFADLLGPNAGFMCRSLVEERFRPSLQEAQAALNRCPRQVMR